MIRSPARLAFALAVLAAPALAAAAGAASFTLSFGDHGHARIPFDLRSQHVWIRGVVNQSDSVWIVVDTGASASVMDEALATRLGLALEGHHEAFGAGGPQSGSSVADVTLRLPGLTLHRDRLDTVGLAALTSQGGRPMTLILGYELFASCVVRFDYESFVMDVWDPDAAPRDTGGVELPMTLIDNHPYVEGALQVAGRAPIAGRFVIDTGSAAGLLVAPEITARESLDRAFPRTIESVARGVGGDLRSRIGRAESFSLGTLRFDRPLVMMPQAGAGRISTPGSVGNIGGQLLGRCRVTFDYPGKRVRLERGSGFDRPYPADMSGATLVRDARGWIVRVVNPDTPASDAGLREGDVVTHVDGDPVERVDPAAFRLLLQSEGRTVRFGIRRGDADSTVSLVLRPLL